MKNHGTILHEGIRQSIRVLENNLQQQTQQQSSSSTITTNNNNNNVISSFSILHKFTKTKATFRKPREGSDQEATHHHTALALGDLHENETQTASDHKATSQKSSSHTITYPSLVPLTAMHSVGELTTNGGA